MFPRRPGYCDMFRGRRICRETPTLMQLGDTHFYALMFGNKGAVSGQGAAKRKERSDGSDGAP